MTFHALITAAQEGALDLPEAVTTAYEWHGKDPSGLYAFASHGGVVSSEEQRQHVLQEVDQCVAWVEANRDPLDNGKYQEYSDDHAAAQEAGISTSDYILSKLDNLKEVVSRALVAKEASKTAAADTPGDTEALKAFMQNSPVLMAQGEAIRQRLQELSSKGTYDPNLAWRLWLVWVDSGAHAYSAQNGGMWYQMFPSETRESMAKTLAQTEEEKMRVKPQETPTPEEPTQVSASLDKEAKVLISTDVFNRAKAEVNELLSHVAGTGSEVEGKLTKIQYELHKLEVQSGGNLDFILDDESSPSTAKWARELIRALSTIKAQAMPPEHVPVGSDQQPAAATASLKSASGTGPSRTAATHEDVSDLMDIPSGGKKTYIVGGDTFVVYFDSEEARGDLGGPVPGMISGNYEVMYSPDGSGNPVGGKIISRQHVSPGKPRGQQQYYAAEQCVDAILRWVNSKGKRGSSKQAGVPEDTVRSLGQFLTSNKDKLKMLMGGRGPEAVAQAMAGVPGGQNAQRIMPVIYQWLRDHMSDSDMVGSLEKVLIRRASLTNEEAMHIVSASLELAGFRPSEIHSRTAGVDVHGLSVTPFVLRHVAKVAGAYGINVRLAPKSAAADYSLPGEQPDSYPEPTRSEPDGIQRSGPGPTEVEPISDVAAVTAALEDEDEGFSDGPTCPACGGPGAYLGALGPRSHFRCQNCGMDFSKVISSKHASHKNAAPEIDVMNGEDKIKVNARKRGQSILAGTNAFVATRPEALQLVEQLKQNPDVDVITISIVWGGQWSMTNEWERDPEPLEDGSPATEWYESVANKIYRTDKQASVADEDDTDTSSQDAPPSPITGALRLAAPEGKQAIGPWGGQGYFIRQNQMTNPPAGQPAQQPAPTQGQPAATPAPQPGTPAPAAQPAAPPPSAAGNHSGPENPVNPTGPGTQPPAAPATQPAPVAPPQQQGSYVTNTNPGTRKGSSARLTMAHLGYARTLSPEITKAMVTAGTMDKELYAALGAKEPKC